MRDSQLIKSELKLNIDLDHHIMVVGILCAKISSSLTSLNVSQFLEEYLI